MTENARRQIPSHEELKAVLAILPTLNHYQLLKVSSVALASEIQSAFHREALLFHPDRYQAQGRRESMEDARKIYVKIVEAYNVLSKREQRMAYDQQLVSGESSEQKPSDAGNPHPSTSSVTQKKVSGPGLKFYKLAQSAHQSGNKNSAKMNIQLALNMEPENSEYKKFAEKLNQTRADSK